MVGGRCTVGEHWVWPVGRVHERVGAGAVHGRIGGALGRRRGGLWAEGPDAVDGLGDVDALAGADVIEIVEDEAGVVALEEGLALGDLELEALCVAARRQRAAVAVLLVAGGAGGGAGGAARVLGVALDDDQLMEIAVGVARRDLP